MGDEDINSNIIGFTDAEVESTEPSKTSELHYAKLTYSQEEQKLQEKVKTLEDKIHKLDNSRLTLAVGVCICTFLLHEVFAKVMLVVILILLAVTTASLIKHKTVLNVTKRELECVQARIALNILL